MEFEHEGPWRLSRRAFLAGSASLLGLAALPAWSRALTANDDGLTSPNTRPAA